MSVQKPSKSDEIAQAIQHGRPFWGPKVHGETIAVLSGRQNVTGPLADAVNETAADYQEQYLTGGGRNRPAWHVVYYVTIADPETAGARFVIAYVTASGEARIQAHRALSKPLTAAVSEGFHQLKTSRLWEDIATERGHYPVQDDDYAGTFTVWGRDARNDVRETLPIAHYADRREAFEAREAFERGGEPYTSPSGYRGTHNHAWITRSATPLGMRWADREELGE